MKKAAISLNILALCLMIFSFFSHSSEKIEESEYEVVGVIGGADGPTSLFITNEISPVNMALPPVLVTALIISTVCILRRNK